MKLKTSLTVLFCLVFVICLRNVSAQTFPVKLLTEIPESAAILSSTAVRERAAILDKLIVNVPGSCTGEKDLPLNLAKEDYEFVVGRILELDLTKLDYGTNAEIWGNIEFLIRKFKMLGQLPTLVKYLDHPNKHIQAGVVYTIRELDARGFDDKLVPLLNSSDKFVREQTLITLVYLESKKAVPILLEQLKDKEKRYYAIESLVKLDAKEAAPEIAKLLKSDDKNIKHTALMALVSLNAREQTLEIWNLVSDNELKSLVVAALIYLADERAIRWFSEQITVDREFSQSVLGQAGTLKAKPIIPALIAILEKGKLSDDRYFDSTLRRSVIDCLGYLNAKEAIPVLRKYARGETSFRKWEAIRILGDLEAKEAVDDLIFVLSRALIGDTDKGYATYGDDYHTIRNAGLALSKIGDKKAWKVLIETAEHPKFYEGSEVIGGLNRFLDSELWEKAKTRKVSGGQRKSLKDVSELLRREAGMTIIFEVEPEGTLEFTDDLWVTTDENSTVFGIIDQVTSALKNKLPREKYTYIFDNGTIRILPLKNAIQWWKVNILTN